MPLTLSLAKCLVKRRQTSMGTKKVTNREHQVIMTIYRHMEEYHDLPSSVDIRERLSIGASHVSNLLRSLLKKSFIERRGSRVALTSEGKEYVLSVMQAFSSSGLPLMPVNIWLRGQVKAGKTKQEDLIVDLAPYSISSDTISLPNTKPGTQIFALEVVGVSMEQEGIKPCDYVVLREMSPGEKPREGDLIVAKYLPYYFLESGQEEVSEDDFFGPTLKYYFTKYQEGREVYVLSSTNGRFQEGKYFLALDIRFIGIVIGVYRDMQRTNVHKCA